MRRVESGEAGWEKWHAAHPECDGGEMKRRHESQNSGVKRHGGQEVQSGARRSKKSRQASSDQDSLAPRAAGVLPGGYAVGDELYYTGEETPRHFSLVHGMRGTVTGLDPEGSSDHIAVRWAILKENKRCLTRMLTRTCPGPEDEAERPVLKIGLLVHCRHANNEYYNGRVTKVKGCKRNKFEVKFVDGTQYEVTSDPRSWGAGHLTARQRRANLRKREQAGGQTGTTSRPSKAAKKSRTRIRCVPKFNTIPGYKSSRGTPLFSITGTEGSVLAGCRSWKRWKHWKAMGGGRKGQCDRNTSR